MEIAAFHPVLDWMSNGRPRAIACLVVQVLSPEDMETVPQRGRTEVGAFLVACGVASG